MAEKIFDEFGMTFDILLVPGEKGVYDVTVEGDHIYSKHETGRHAEYEEVAEKIREHV